MQRNDRNHLTTRHTIRRRDSRTLARVVLGVFALCATVAAAAPSASAQELLGNGLFDADMAGWTASEVSVPRSWDGTRDAQASELSGSLEIVHQLQPKGNSYYGLFTGRCTPVAAGVTSVFAGAQIRFREGETSEGNVYVMLRAHSDAICKSPDYAGEKSNEVKPQVDGRGIWLPVDIGITSEPLAIPPGTKSVQIWIWQAMFKGPKLTINVDDVFLAPTGTPVCGGLPATIIGTSNPEFLFGTTASDVIVGRGGADQVDGKAGNDRICGDAGGDLLYGGLGDDMLFGDGGEDTLYGAQGDDRLVGGGAKDTLYGGPDDDIMKGNGGNDTCDGSTGFDSAKTCETVTGAP